MINKKDIKHLESLLLMLAVTQYSGKRKASEALNTSVDTINKYIDDLEQDLSLKLLYSDGRGSNLTENGKRLLESAKQIKHILNNIYISADKSNLTSECAGEVRVAMTVGVDSSLKFAGIGEFYDTYPDIKILSMTSNESPKLDDMSYDIGLAYEEPTSSDTVVLYKVPVRCGFFASPAYLDKHGYPIDYEDMLKKHRLVNKANSGNYIKCWKDTLKKAKNICFTTNSMFSLCEAVRNGAGIGIMPLHYVKEDLVCIDNIKCECNLSFYLFSHVNVKDIPRIRAVINLYKIILDNMSA